MLEADDAKNHAGQTHEQWAEWQRAATDYWLLLHPELEPFRRGDVRTVPTVADFRTRAKLIGESMHGIPDTWRVLPPSAAKVERLARVGWFHELMVGMYDPIASAIQRVNEDRSAVETLVRFLEADVYCHRSGYAKSDVIRSLKRATGLDQETQQRLRVVILAAVDGPDRREFRDYVRLARVVVDEKLRSQLRARIRSESPAVARHARWMLEGIGARSQKADVLRDELLSKVFTLLGLVEKGQMSARDVASILATASLGPGESDHLEIRRALMSLAADLEAIEAGGTSTSGVADVRTRFEASLRAEPPRDIADTD